MKFIFITLTLILTITTKTYAIVSCDIYIHGVGPDTSSFRNMPLSVEWDTTLEIEDASPKLAYGILEEMENCDLNTPIFLRTHNYGSSIVHYILGQGKRFAKIYPKHDFVQVFKKTTAVYSYAGAFKGTPLMDLVCSNGDFNDIREIFDDTCVLSLSTSDIHHPTNNITSPGVPIYLITSTKSEGKTGNILSSYRFNKKYDYTSINQNDGIILQSSSKACFNSQDIFNANSKCDKIDPSFFHDFINTDQFSHFELIENKELLIKEHPNYEN